MDGFAEFMRDVSEARSELRAIERDGRPMTVVRIRSVVFPVRDRWNLTTADATGIILHDASDDACAIAYARGCGAPVSDIADLAEGAKSIYCQDADLLHATAVAALEFVASASRS